MGIGHLKGGGSIAAAVTCIAWWFAQPDGNFHGAMILATGVITLIGIGVATKVEPHWGKDSSKVVIDEVAGMCVSLLFVPVTPVWMITGFVLFRFFDMVKPLYIRKTEALPSGWGVMADDLLSGIYANLVLQAIRHWI